MTRQSIIVILVFNVVVIAIGITVYSLIHQSHRDRDAEEFQRRLSERLASVTTPAKMQSASADIAKMAAYGDHLVQDSVAALKQTWEFLVLIGGARRLDCEQRSRRYCVDCHSPDHL